MLAQLVRVERLPSSLRSARGDGIVPVTSATPQDMRFSASGGWNQWPCRNDVVAEAPL